MLEPNDISVLRLRLTIRNNAKTLRKIPHLKSFGLLSGYYLLQNAGDGLWPVEFGLGKAG